MVAAAALMTRHTDARARRRLLLRRRSLNRFGREERKIAGLTNNLIVGCARGTRAQRQLLSSPEGDVQEDLSERLSTALRRGSRRFQ